jgi:hypothetical protein
MSTDTRNVWERMRRRELWKLGKAWGVPYPPGAGKDQMIPILMANNVDPNNPKGAFEFEEVPGEDEAGRAIINRYPKRPEHATARQDIDYAQIMESKEVENSSLKDEVAELKALVEKLTENQITLVKHKEKIGDPLKTSLENKYSDTPWKELRALAKSKGIKLLPKYKREDIIRELEALG